MPIVQFCRKCNLAVFTQAIKTAGTKNDNSRPWNLGGRYFDTSVNNLDQLLRVFAAGATNTLRATVCVVYSVLERVSWVHPCLCVSCAWFVASGCWQTSILYILLFLFAPRKDDHLQSHGESVTHIQMALYSKRCIYTISSLSPSVFSTPSAPGLHNCTEVKLRTDCMCACHTEFVSRPFFK